jgi:hypothetical protein
MQAGAREVYSFNCSGESHCSFRSYLTSGCVCVAESLPRDGIAGTGYVCFPDRIRHRLRLQGRCGPRPTVSYAILCAGPRRREAMRDRDRAKTQACASLQWYRCRRARRCLDRAPALFPEDRLAECESSTRVRRNRNRRCSGPAELRENTSGKCRGR